MLASFIRNRKTNFDFEMLYISSLGEAAGHKGPRCEYISIHNISVIYSMLLKKNLEVHFDISYLVCILKISSTQEFTFCSLPVPVTCMERANVRTRARFSSSDSADTKVLGSLRNRDNCG
jgi:hypothetical protein